MAKRKSISPSEIEALNALWEHGPQTHREVHQVLLSKGKTWAGTTVQTLLQRLQAKGVVNSELKGGTSIFTAAESKDDFLQRGFKSLSEDTGCGGPMPLVLNLIKASSFTQQQIDELQSLLEKHKAAE